MNEVQVQNKAHTAAPHVGEVTAVKQASPMLRSAKLVCQSGEYVCLVRDVSQDGVLLSFLHDVPCEPRVFLALANGQTHPIQRIWSGESQAGYRFVASVTVEEFLHERAPFAVRPVRLSVEASARVLDGSESHVARLLDISTHGAKFECAADHKASMGRGRTISFQAHSMGQQLSDIIWCDRASGEDRVNGQKTQGNVVQYGVQFQQPLTLRALAQATLRMQPFGPAAPRSFSEPLRKASAA